MIFCSFRDQELKELHYGFATDNFETVICACCGREFEVGEDAKILEILPTDFLCSSLYNVTTKRKENEL